MLIAFVALGDGKEYVAVIEFDAKIRSDYILEDGKGDKYHTTVTVFEPDVERDGEAFDYIEYLLLRGDNQELDIIKENPYSEAAIRQTEATAPEKEFSNDSISQESESVNSKFSNRIDDSMSNRPQLANALESVAQSPMGKQKLAEYKAKIYEKNKEEKSTVATIDFS